MTAAAVVVVGVVPAVVGRDQEWEKDRQKEKGKEKEKEKYHLAEGLESEEQE